MKITASLLLLPALSGFGLAAQAADTPSAGYHLVKTISLPGTEGWDYIYTDSDAHLLYISHGTHVAIVDTRTGQVAGDIPDTAGVHGVAIDAKDGRGFTSNGRANTVTVFDLKTFKKLGETPVGEGTDAIVYEPVTNRVFTFNGRSGTATAIDAATGVVAGTVTLPGRPEFPVADGMGHLYDNIEDKSEIVSIDPKSLKVVATWPLAPGTSPSGLTMDRKTRRLFAVCDNQKLAVMDADTGKLVATPAIGNGPDACAFDPSRSLIFSPNGEDGTMTVIHEVTPDTYEVVGTITTQTGARTMTIDTKTGHLFTVTAKQAPPAPDAAGTAPAPGGRRRRSYVEGSFVVLEFAPA